MGTYLTMVVPAFSLRLSDGGIKFSIAKRTSLLQVEQQIRFIRSVQENEENNKLWPLGEFNLSFLVPAKSFFSKKFH